MQLGRCYELHSVAWCADPPEARGVECVDREDVLPLQFERQQRLREHVGVGSPEPSHSHLIGRELALRVVVVVQVALVDAVDVAVVEPEHRVEGRLVRRHDATDDAVHRVVRRLERDVVRAAAPPGARVVRVVRRVQTRLGVVRHVGALDRPGRGVVGVR